MRCLAALCVGIILSTSGPAGAQDCQRAGEEDGIAEGRLIERGGALILKLPAPMCLEGAEDSDNVAESAEVHAYSRDEDMAGTLRALVGKDVLLRGRFFGSLTQHHKAPIVMDVSEADEI